MQPNKPGVSSSYMDVDEAQEAQGGAGSVGVDERSKEGDEDNVTEQTHHIIVPSYR